MANLFRVLVPVTDIEAGVRFYGEVLEATGKRVSPGRHYFDCGGTILACFDPEADGEGRVASPNPESIYLAVSDLEKTYRLCESAGATFPSGSPPGVGPLAEIAERPWGETSFYVVDPYGNDLCFVSEESVFRG